MEKNKTELDIIFNLFSETKRNARCDNKYTTNIRINSETRTKQEKNHNRKILKPNASSCCFEKISGVEEIMTENHIYHAIQKISNILYFVSLAIYR